MAYIQLQETSSDRRLPNATDTHRRWRNRTPFSPCVRYCSCIITTFAAAISFSAVSVVDWLTPTQAFAMRVV